MAKGNQAKEQVTNAIIQAMGNNFIAVVDKKIYAWADDGEEKVQVAISLTCPKIPIAAGDVPSGTTASGGEVAPTPVTPTELSPADAEKVADLMQKLGIN